MGLLQLEMTADVLAGLRSVEELYLLRSTILDLGAGRYQITAYGAEALIPELEERGCTVQLLMSTDGIEEFHNRVADAVQTPEERAAARSTEVGGQGQPGA